MIEPQRQAAKSLDTHDNTSGPTSSFREAARVSSKSSTRVAIHTLEVVDRASIASHLLALDRHDRHLRFGFTANDEQIRRYVERLNFEADDIFGIYNRRLELVAMAHLAFSIDPQLTPCAEFGVSVSSSVRGRGYGARLFDRAALHARNEGVSLMFIHALSENAVMLRIARQAGAVVERDGTESEAHLRLLPATLDTRFTEMLEEQVARADYRLKWQFKILGDLFSSPAKATKVKEGAAMPSELR